MKMKEILLDQITKAIKKKIPRGKIGISFSGGVDSSLIAKICSDMKYDVTLLTIGFPKSHDILFANEVNQKMNLPHNILEIDCTDFGNVSRKIKKIINTENLSWNENCIAFYYVSKLAKSLGLLTVITANGIDELFCGYNAYRDIVSDGELRILEVMETKLVNEIEMMKKVDLIASEFNVRFIQPLLSPDFIDFAKTIPIKEKIHDSDDLIRKHIIRNLAKDVGVPEISYNKRKKAMQYGSKIHKELLKTR
jgi:asparagine synthase (glutamine-hydrolysing)